MKATTNTVARLAALALALVAPTACSGAGPGKVETARRDVELANAFGDAFDGEAQGAHGPDAWLDVLDAAVASPPSPRAIAAASAAADALVGGASPFLGETGPGGLVYRARENAARVAERLARAWERAERSAPFVRAAIAMAAHELSLFSGDDAAATVWSRRRGCASEAAVVGPTDWAVLSGIEGAGPVAPLGALPKTFPGIAPFAARIEPVVVRADACRLDVNASSFLQGVREVVVDYDVPTAQTIHVALVSTSAAVVDVGGVRALRREFSAGGRAVVRLSDVDVGAGRLRVVVRLAQRNEGNVLELDAFADDGTPLAGRAPRAGDAATSRATAARPVDVGAGARDAGANLALAAAAQMALGDGRAAEHAMEEALAGKPRGDWGPRLSLLYARAVEIADDVPDTKRIERLRAATDATLAAWPTAWEARIAHAQLTERRRGQGEGAVEALRELTAPGGASADRMVLATAAAIARRASITDVSEASYDALAAAAPGSPLLASVDARLHGRVGTDAVRAQCNGGLSRAETGCLFSLIEVGDRRKVESELARLRRLRTAPDALRDVELSHLLRQGDLAAARAIYDALPPGQRYLLGVPALLAGRGDGEAALRLLARDKTTARDAPFGIASLVRAAGREPDPAADFEAEGLRVVEADKKSAFLPGAGTAVLRHVERYVIERSGLVRWSLYDLRRVSGTTDVQGGGLTYGPVIEGRGTPRILRRRIHKRDGRVLEPDAAANAMQAGSEMSQLEQGDYVELILQGWALPGDTGQLVIDTPDLLPERTSVRDAEIELARDPAVAMPIWSHPLLGKPVQRTERDLVVSTWRLSNQAPRRIEDGVPRLERSVGLSLGTQTWANVGRALGENVRSLLERDPAVRAFALEAAGADKTPSVGLVERVVTAVGKKVKVASGAELSDVAALFGGGAQRTTARTTLELGQGSRSWVVYRLLRELGVEADLAVAETEPFSSAPDFPPHAGRFRRPLVVAHLPGAGGARSEASDVWIDADVEGPPLPPGRVSPELRGRVAMLQNGAIVPVAGTAGEMGDEVDVRLALDARGDAKGTFTVLLRGRSAQALSEAFETVVGSERLRMLRGVVLAWLPWADVEEVKVSSQEGSWEVALRADIRIQGFGRPEGKDGKVWALPGLEPVHFAFPGTIVGTLGATYASRAARQSALSIDSPLSYHVHRRIELPEGSTLVRPAGVVAVADPRVQATRKGTFDGKKVIEEDFALSLPTGTVAAGAYPAFVANVQAIDAGFMATTRVKVKP